MRKLGVSILIIRTHFSNINNRHQDINLCKFLDTIMQHMNAKKKKKKKAQYEQKCPLYCLFFIQRTSILQNCLEECRCTECIQPLSSKNLTGGGGGVERCCEGSCPKNDHQQDGILAPNSWWSTFLPRTLSRSLALSGPSNMMLLSAFRSPLHWESSAQDDCGRLLQFLLAAIEFGV